MEKLYQKLGCKPTFLPYNVCRNFPDEGLDVSATKTISERRSLDASLNLIKPKTAI